MHIRATHHVRCEMERSKRRSVTGPRGLGDGPTWSCSWPAGKRGEPSADDAGERREGTYMYSTWL